MAAPSGTFPATARVPDGLITSATEELPRQVEEATEVVVPAPVGPPPTGPSSSPPPAAEAPTCRFAAARVADLEVEESSKATVHGALHAVSCQIGAFSFGGKFSFT